MDKKIVVICYNQIETWNDRQMAMDFYEDCARNCEGCERERYLNIYWDLKDGEDYASDHCSMPWHYLDIMGRHIKTTAPDGSRDFGGKIWFPA